jgi:hypothetical protein
MLRASVVGFERNYEFPYGSKMKGPANERPLAWPHKPMRVGELARRCEAKIKDIDELEAAGVLPIPKRSLSGYRMYEVDQIDVVKEALRNRRDSSND